MSSRFIGEIRMFGGNFAPVGWAFCNGALMDSSQNDALFNLIGTPYGGDGQTTFALPNLQSRVPVHVGPGFALGQAAGAETVTLTTSQLPAHSHVPVADSNVAGQASPQNNVWAGNNTLTPYSNTAPNQVMDPAAMGSAVHVPPPDKITPFFLYTSILSFSFVFS